MRRPDADRRADRRAVRSTVLLRMLAVTLVPATVLVPAVLLLPAMMLAPAAAARDLPYGAVSDPAVVKCDTQNWSPRHFEAAGCYRRLADGGATAAQRAEGAWALGMLARANELFRTAVAAHPQDAQLRVRWGELYVDSHQSQQALDLFQEALKRDPGNAYARIDAAAVLADEYAAQADSDLQAVLKDADAPAGARLRALLLAARVALEDSDAAQAQGFIEQAGQLAARAQLPQLELDALRAALAQFQGQDGAAWMARAIREDPGFGEAYALPAHFYDIRWREAEAVALYRQAIAVQPDLWSAQVQLASCLLRLGRIAQGRALLQDAYRGDPYDPVTVNTLRLLDSLGQFTVLPFDRRPDGTPALVLRISAQESAVLAPYARRLAERALQAYSQRYRFVPREPVDIEIYPNHDDLAVRTAGLPGLGGELGVTFGYVVAIDSPGTRAPGEFHWGDTLWHEMAHVFTLESTDFRVPRWLTEGLSVFEQWHSGPIRGIEIPDYVFAALAQGKALPIASLDRGFVHPQYPEQLVVSYMQAGLVCDYVDRSFGFDKLLALLHAFDTTSDVSTALQRSLGLTAAQFDARFHADLLQRYGELFAHIDAWRSARAAAAAAAAGADWPAAMSDAGQALALLRQDVGDASPYLPLVQAYDGSGQPQRALATLMDYWQRGGHDPQALERLAQRLHAAGRTSESIAALDSVNYVAPFDEQLHGQLGDWLLQAGRAGEALGEYRIAMAMNPPDEATAHLRLARAQYALHALPEARREVFAALEVAPNFRPAQQLLLQLERGTGAPGAPGAAGTGASSRHASQNSSQDSPHRGSQ